MHLSIYLILTVINERISLRRQGEPGLRGFPGPVGKPGPLVSKCIYQAAVRIRALPRALQKGLGETPPAQLTKTAVGVTANGGNQLVPINYAGITDANISWQIKAKVM